MKRERLIKARHRKGWSQEKAAEELKVSWLALSKWERGLTKPHPANMRRLCEVYGITEDEIEDTSVVEEVLPQIVSHEKEIVKGFSLVSQEIKAIIIETVLGLTGTSIDSTFILAEKDDMKKKRREFLHLLGNAGVVLALLPSDLDLEQISGALSKPARLDENGLRNLKTINHSLWNLYLTVPLKSSILDAAQGQFQTLVQFLKNPYPTPMRKQLCARVSEIGQLMGEIFFDLNDHNTAKSCYTFAAIAAKEAEAYDLWACAFVRHAFLPIYREHYVDALPLLQEAFRIAKRGDHTLPTQYWVAAVEAEAQSGICDLVACHKALDHAQSVPNTKEIELPWIRFNATRLPALRGACYVRLQQPELAIPTLQEALLQFVKPGRKWGMVFTDLAAAALQRDNVELAQAYVDEAMDMLALGSSRFLYEALRALPQRIESTAPTPSIKAFNQYIGQRLAMFS